MTSGIMRMPWVLGDEEEEGEGVMYVAAVAGINSGVETSWEREGR